MSKPLTPAELHKRYDELMTAFRRQLADPSSRVAFGREADAFMRDCACGLWQTEMGLTPLHVEYYNAMYAKGNAVPTVLYWELTGYVQNYSGFVLPAFFRRLVQADLERRESRSRKFVDDFTLLMQLFAAADLKVSPGEDAFILSCADSMTRFCDQAGVIGGKPGRTPPPPSRPAKPKEDSDAQSSAPAPSSSQANAAAPDADAEKQQAADQKEKEPTLEELLAELDSLCGLTKVKEDVKGLINLVKVRKLRESHGLPVPPLSLHLVFMGNPGTGKTTVARLLAKLYHAIGVLSKGQLVEVDRSGLVAGYVGQTALKTQDVVQKALGGVLFIDEAYSLTNQDNPNDFGQEAVEIILKAMEDHRDDLIVVVAGYTDLMTNFIHSNPGLESRFNKYILFEDYDGEQLAAIFRSMCQKNGYIMDEATDKAAEEAFQVMFLQRDENFGNARDVRNVFENAVARQANRVASMESPTKEDLMALTISDLDLEEDKPASPEDAPAPAPAPAADQAPAPSPEKPQSSESPKPSEDSPAAPEDPKP